MRKTKVTLALGAHGQVDWKTGSKPGLNNKFFRRAAGEFIEKIKKKRRELFGLVENDSKGLLVFECAYPLATYDSGRVNKHLIHMLDRTLNVGEPVSDPRADWGFNDLILEANDVHRRIHCWMEMQTKDAMVQMAQLLAVNAQLNQVLSQDERLELETEYLRLEMSSSLLRDKTVLEMIGQARGLMPIAGVLVPRGLAHKPMHVLFDDSYDVRIKEDGYYLPHFYREAMERFYREGGLEDHEFERVARLMMTWERLVEERNIPLSDNEGRKTAAKEAEQLCK